MIGATLFSGIGAPEVAMPGWRWPWHAEIEKFPSAVMAARHPYSVNLGDVTADDFCERASAIAKPDVLVFGSPCQDFSIAGKRLGMDGARGNLALTALRIVARLEPRWFVFENVPGLLSSFSGSEHAERQVREGPVGGQGDGEENRDIATFLSCVHELGYSGAWASLDAQFRGLAQRRDRLFFVGHSGDWRYPAAVLLEPESLCGDTPPRREAGKGVAPTIASRPTGGGLGTDFDCDGGLIAFGGNNTAGPIDVATACNSHGGPAGRIDFESETFVVGALQGGGSPRGHGTAGVNSQAVAAGHIVPVAFDTTQITSKGNYSEPKPGEPCHPLAAGAHPPVIAFSCKDHGADASDVAPTLRAMGHSGSHPNAGGRLAVAVALRGRDGGGTAELSDIPSALRASQGGGDKPHVMTSAVRRLIPRECERLQGYEDDYTLITYRGKPAADGPRYKALGNSMAVPVMRWILTRIEIVEATHTQVPMRGAA